MGKHLRIDGKKIRKIYIQRKQKEKQGGKIKKHSRVKEKCLFVI